MDSFNKRKEIFWIAFVCGFYPLVFYCANNFYAVNSWGHIGYFTLFFIGLSFLGFGALELFFRIKKDWSRFRPQATFVTIVMVTATLMSYAMKLRLQKKILLGILVLSVLLSIKFSDRYKKVVLLIFIMALLPFGTIFLKVYEQQKDMSWTALAADIKEVTLAETPNIYLIQPDGYVNHTLMNGSLYQHETTFFNWLEGKGFTLYDDFRSNYPASIPSNASMFSMQHHYFGETYFSNLEMPMGREVTSGENTTNYVFRKNGYKTYFLAQDEYFQQNLKFGNFSHYNISKDDIPFFSRGDEHVRVLLDDLDAVLLDEVDQPKFVFIEKLLPHHIHFVSQEDQIENERKEYTEKIEEVNIWLTEAIERIERKDPKAVIIILADHGGWVGMTSYPDMFTTRDEANIHSIFSVIAAIKWNGYLQEGYDQELSSTVNLFRVLFANLARDRSYLKDMEDNSSYNLHRENWYRNSVYQVINDKGEVVYLPHNP
ncbi:MAG: sulfatase-like hydrolase/transferase [Bacteroidota bacterium]